MILKTSSKGLTPVIATVLLMTISIAAAASAYTFITQAQKQAANNFEQNLNQQQLRDKSDLNIEYVYNSTGNFTIMTVRNTGSISLKILDDNGDKVWSLYSDGRPVSSGAGKNGKGWKFFGNSVDIINPSEVVSINTTVTFPAAGDDKAFKLVGPYDTKDSHVCVNTGTASC